YIVLVILKFLVWCSSSPFEELVLVEPFSRIVLVEPLFKNWCSSSPLEELVLVEPLLKNGCSSSPFECRGAIQLEQLIIVFRGPFPQVLAKYYLFENV
ncbi:MAG: hypothetical protein ACK56F_07395, partial [bacterium]